MHGFSFTRRRRKPMSRGGDPTWQDNMPTWDSGQGDGRYVHIPEIDRWRAVPFDMMPGPQQGAVMERVRQLTSSLDGAIDEGTGASLDPLIESWTGSWIASVETEYVDHCAVISVQRGQARQWLTEARLKAEHEREKLDQIHADLTASRRRLTGEPSPYLAGPASFAGPESFASPESAAPAEDESYDGYDEQPEDAAWMTSAPDPLTHQDWSAPHLVAGRSFWVLLVGAVLIAIGAMADAIAFHNTLEFVLASENAVVSWLMAIGTTSIALVAAASLGCARAVRHRGRYLDPMHRPSRLPLVLAATVWLGLGLAMFIIRWLGQNVNGSVQLTLTPHASSSVHHSVLPAIFFGAIYLVSGACTILESERLYNPEYFAFRRLHKQYRIQAQQMASAEAAKDRAEAVMEQHDAELQREDQRRLAAVADRQALGAEAANYARVLMAAMMRDPAKTAITETGPVPQLTTTFGAQAADGSGGAAFSGGGTQGP